MASRPDLPGRPVLGHAAASVLLLHPPDVVDTACALASAWRPVVPAAEIVLLSVRAGEVGNAATALLAHRLDRAQLDVTRMVLAGICGAEGLAFRLAFGEGAAACAGVLTCGGAPLRPPFEPLSDLHARRGTRLRLVWEARDPLRCAGALGRTLSRFRAVGLDAQGTVLRQEEAGGDRTEGGPSPALMRLTGAYLGELVAITLGAAPRCGA
ncbi:MAG TPA: hypothetical protein VE684_22295 [Crenalkalicoccus sp.]|jgi:hypothetical protein|nr:hypothetical protein [Crenalkalicoccus sp.]